MDFYPFNHKHCVLTEGNRAILACHFDDNSDMHHYCGYVALPIGSVPVEWRGDYNADALQYLAIHGGITYCDVAPKEEPEFVVFGFDCDHCDDDENPDLKDVSYVMRLTAQMESQLIAYAKRIDEWRAANRARRIEIIESIINEAQVKTELGFGAMIGILFGGASEFGVGEESGAAENKEAGTQLTTPAGVPETQCGERSCVHIAVWPGFCGESHCNVDCAHYEHDGITAPDSKPARRKDAVDGQFTSKISANTTRRGV